MVTAPGVFPQRRRAAPGAGTARWCVAPAPLTAFFVLPGAGAGDSLGRHSYSQTGSDKPLLDSGKTAVSPEWSVLEELL